jgi:hypothetical protein
MCWSRRDWTEEQRAEEDRIDRIRHLFDSDPEPSPRATPVTAEEARPPSEEDREKVPAGTAG